MNIKTTLHPDDLKAPLARLWELSGKKIRSMTALDPRQGSPVVTVRGRYEPRSWTDWTQGFQYGSELLQFDATGDRQFLDLAIDHIKSEMAPHVSHFGVHDHGFNNLSSYGNLLRLINEGKAPEDPWLKEFCVLALRMSAAVQAKRWTKIPEGGFIYSFNGPHSLFVDTIRTIRILVAGHQLGHHLSAENDVRTSLLKRAYQHALATARYSVYYGEGRDMYDEWGRTAHEAIFNTNDGNFRSPSTQQGYSGYSTWTRGLSWAMLGFTEQLEFLRTLDDGPELSELGGRDALENTFLKAARATCDFYLANSARDGITYWDTGAPGLVHLTNWRDRAADPYNDWEPVDSSAGAIGAQALLRLGAYLAESEPAEARRYQAAGLTLTEALLSAPYLSEADDHQGLLLHGIYHRPNGWDYIPEGHRTPHGEACMWGDYHLRELALYLGRIIDGTDYYTFFKGIAA